MARNTSHDVEFVDELDLFIQEQSKDPAFAEALRDAEERANCIRELITARKRSGITQQTVATTMGTSQSTVSEFESGDADVFVSTLQRYARAVGSCVRVVVTYPGACEVDVAPAFNRSAIKTVTIDNSGWSTSRRRAGALWPPELTCSAR